MFCLWISLWESLGKSDGTGVVTGFAPLPGFSLKGLAASFPACLQRKRAQGCGLLG
jgi:hypothetical protein